MIINRLTLQVMAFVPADGERMLPWQRRRWKLFPLSDTPPRVTSSWNHLEDAKMLPVQCRMARAALGMGRRELAAAADVHLETILRFERGEALRSRTIAALRIALEAAGIEFIPENGDAGAGVRLRIRSK